MTKIVLNCKLKVKQAINNQDCDKVPLFVICIDTLAAKGVHTVKRCNITVYNTEHSLPIKCLIMGNIAYVASTRLHWARRPISLVVNYKYVQACKSL